MSSTSIVHRERYLVHKIEQVQYSLPPTPSPTDTFLYINTTNR